eukprot:403334969
MIGQGLQFYNISHQVQVINHNLTMQPYYLQNIGVFNDGTYLNVDCGTKFNESRSILDLFTQLKVKKNFTNQDIYDKYIPKITSKKRLIRYQRICTLIERFQCSKVLDNWGLKIESQFTQVKAKQLPCAQIYTQPQDIFDWPYNKQSEKQFLQQIDLKYEKWAIIYAFKDFTFASILVHFLNKASKGFGITIEEPQFVEIGRKEGRDLYSQAINLDIDPFSTKLVVIIIDDQKQKPQIKALLDKMGVPSQFIKRDTIIDKGYIPAVFSNLLKQIVAKLNHQLYNVYLPSLRNSMIVGINIVNVGNQSKIGLCASMNQEISQFYTKVESHNNPQHVKNINKRLSQNEQETIIAKMRTETIGKFLLKSLSHYQKKNAGDLPDQIIIYRDGIGGLTFKRKLKRYEIEKVLKTISQFKKGYDPMIIYCLIDKKTSLRLFHKENIEAQNPSPGTVLDNQLVKNNGEQIFDFYMIPHKALSGTAKPVHFNVVHNTSTISKEQFEISTYHLCYNYANVSEPIKTPSPCMYAKKIALYAAQNNVVPNKNLDFTLHFL